MTRVKIRTIHEAIATHAAKRVLAISQRFDVEHIWEDGKKIDRPKYRNAESAFLAVLLENGIWNAPVAEWELKSRARELRKKGSFDIAVVMGELPYQNISIAARLRKIGFKKPIFIEITKDSANRARDVGATVTAAQRVGSPELLRNLVYLTKTRPSPPFLDLDIDLPLEVPLKDAAPKTTRKRATVVREFVQQASDLAEPPARMRSVITRVIRDTKTARALKVRYDFRCQVCGTTIGFPGGIVYIEVHHIKPLGGAHGGTDTNDNMLVVCPNHHAMLDYGFAEFVSDDILRIGAETFNITSKHSISRDSIAYHNERLRLRSEHL